MLFSFIKKEKLKKSIFLLLIFPAISLGAEINFSEIMADPAGTDTNREWVEIKNSANYPINLEKYKFCDSGSCHYIYEYDNGGTKIPANSFGILTKSPDQFKKDYPNFSGFILKSSFSLTNSGEKLELKNENGSVISVVEYKGEICGDNGDTCALFGDIWKNGKATPGAENIFKAKEENNSGSSESSDDEVQIDRTYVEISDVIDGKKKLKAEIIGDIPTLMAGAENTFHGRAYGITGIEIRGAEYFWYTGDGEKKYGKNIKHTYDYPGKYVLTLIVKSANFTGNVRKIVEVINPSVEISAVDSKKNWIKIKNNYSKILKLDNWKIFVDGDEFKIPEETYILGNSEVIFPNKITNLDVRDDSNIFLLFPNGEKQSKFVEEKEVVMMAAPEAPPKKADSKKTEKKDPKIKKFIKNIFHKKEQDFAQQNSAKNKLENDFNERNFIEIEKKEIILKKNEERNFAPQNFSSKNISLKQNLKIQDTKSFFLENKYFIIFIILTSILIIISFLLNHFSKKNLIKNTILREALEYEIEEE